MAVNVSSVDEVHASLGFARHEYMGKSTPLAFAYPVGQLFGRRLIPRVEFDERPHSLLATVRRITEETADFQLEDWQVEFHGAHWDILGGVKYRWDPEGLFWAPLGVGSEKWRLEKGGRLCKVVGYIGLPSRVGAQNIFVSSLQSPGALKVATWRPSTPLNY
ncbi:FAD-binding type 2 [Penicillium viridicatum]|nr:FAD-binding type 2 [Penicillium viridicatum]